MEKFPFFKEVDQFLKDNIKNFSTLSGDKKNYWFIKTILEKFQNFIEELGQESEEKANAFKSAIMVLSSPKSVGVSSEENIHTVAKGFMLHSAGKSINISTQNSLSAQVSKKLSLFAAREDASLIAGVGKILIKSISYKFNIT